MGTLRALLAITVVLAHSPWRDGDVFVGGDNAVRVFYMISGFLIHHVLARNSAYASTKTFYASRLLRLLPVYYAVALLSLLIAPVLVPVFFSVYAQVPLSAGLLLALANLVVFGQDWVMFLGIQGGKLGFSADFKTSEVPLHQGLLIPPAWTLGIELCFYALAPFILRRLSALLALLGLSLGLRLWLLWIGLGAHDPWSYRFFPTELALFLVGALCDRYLRPRWEDFLARRSSSPLPLAVSAGMVVITVSYTLVPLPGPHKTLLLVVVSALALPLLFVFQNQSRLDRQIGELSYPIYIGHMLVIRVLHRLAYHAGGASAPVMALLNVLGALIFALLLNACVARPLEARRTRLKQARAPAA